MVWLSILVRRRNNDYHSCSYTNECVMSKTIVASALVFLLTSNVRLEAIASDDVSLQSYHFKTAEDITWVAMPVATLVWGNPAPCRDPVQST